MGGRIAGRDYIIVKRCYKCSNRLPPTDEYFDKDGRTKDGFKSWCRRCIETFMELPPDVRKIKRRQTTVTRKRNRLARGLRLDRERRCKATLGHAHKNTHGGKRCLHHPRFGSDYCTWHLDYDATRRFKHSEREKLYPLLMELWQDELPTLFDFEPLTTLRESMDYIRFSVRALTGHPVSRPFMLKWYNENIYLKSENAPSPHANGKRPLAVLLGIAPPMRFCPYCGNKAEAEHGWQRGTLKRHKSGGHCNV